LMIFSDLFCLPSFVLAKEGLAIIAESFPLGQ